MHSVKLIIQKTRVKKDGTCPIYLLYFYSRTKKKQFRTNKSVEPKHWDENQGVVKASHPNYQQINAYLRSLQSKMQSIVDSAILQEENPTIEYVEHIFNEKTHKSKPIVDTVFFDHFNEFIEYKEIRVTNDVIKDYKSLRKHLKGWEKYNKRKVVFDKINDEFFFSFVHYLEYGLVKPNGEVGLSKNSVHKVIKNLKAFLNHSYRVGWIKKIDFSAWKVQLVKTQAVYVSSKELMQLLNLDLSDEPRLDQIRDLFIIGCETGLRYSDLSRLSWNHIDEDKKLIRMTVSKTSDNVVIPVSNLLYFMLCKYDDAREGRRDLPTNFHMNEFNREIKVIAHEAGITQYVTKWKIVGNKKTEISLPKNELISSHTCRRSFCTNQFLKGMPAILIRKISGHKKESTFLRYIKVDEEEAALKMIQLWEEMRRKSNN